MLDYKLWQMETDDPDVFARLATRREDMPAPGMPHSEGKDVAHDVVLQLGDKRLRIQTKQGPGEDERGKRTYDEKVIKMIREKESGLMLNVFLKAVGDAYQGDANAAKLVDIKLKEYGLYHLLTAPVTHKAAGHLALAGLNA